MTDSMNVAIYARVSSEHQAEARTIESQIAALLERVAGDGHLLSDEMQFIDDGYSGATLIRPGLERLRDVAAGGALDRVYVHSPDRLARKYAYQVLLIDEFERNGVEVAFLNRELGRSPEDQLLLQVQGMVAEYERAKIIERHRRGKRHAAKSGAVNVLSGAPYGYRYVSRHEGSGHARYEVIPDEARVVRQVFDWIVNERVSIGEVRRRLQNAKETTRNGKAFWDRASIWAMLKNPAYKGAAAFGKTRLGPMRPRLRAQRGRTLQPRRAYSYYDMPQEEWITIAVPALVDEGAFDAAQEQLRENQRHARMRLRGARYLLQGLINCACCGYAFYGKALSNKASKGKRRDYAYYRCIGADAYRFGGQRVCSNTQVRTDTLDLAVWGEVRRLLENPDRLATEYKSRLRPKSKEGNSQVASLDVHLRKLRRGLARLIDSYADCLIEKSEFESRLAPLRERIGKLEAQAKRMDDDNALQSELTLIVGRLEEFTSRVTGGLDSADWTTKRDIIRALVKRVAIDKGQVNVVFRVDQFPFDSGPERGHLQHCWRGSVPCTSQRVPPLCARPVVSKGSE